MRFLAMLRPEIIKASLVVASKIYFCQIVVCWLFPFVHPLLAWGYVVFSMFAYHFIVESEMLQNSINESV